MANTRMILSNVEVVVDDKGTIIGIVSPNGKVAYFPISPQASASAAALTGSTAEQTLATMVVPAGSLGPNGRLRISAHVTHTNSANNKTIRFKANGTTFLTWTDTTTASRSDNIVLANRGNLNNQVVIPSEISNSAVALATAAIDFSKEVVITITGQLALGTETLTLEQSAIQAVPAN